MTPKRVLIVAGEASGDLHASNLVKDIKKLKGDVKFFGLGGKLLKDAGVDISFDLTRLSHLGLVDVIKDIFLIGRVYKDILKTVDSSKTDLAILVDYPGFNLRLAKELKKRSIPVVYYISPQVWAWGRDRIRIIKKCVSKMLVLFKFEEELYKSCGVNVEFVGHPLLDIVKPRFDRAHVFAKYGLSENKRTVAILPGSRESEVKNFLPTLLGACRIIARMMGGVQFVIAKHASLPMELFTGPVKESGLDVAIAEQETYEIVSASDFAIVKSGTATLETAIIGTPYVLVYKGSLINFILARLVMKVDYFGLANIIAGKTVVTELIQYDMTPEKISAAALNLLCDDKKIFKMHQDLKDVRLALGSPGASARAARAILPYLQ